MKQALTSLLSIVIFIILFSAAVLAQNTGWENYMNAAKNAFGKGDYPKAEELSQAALHEAKNFGNKDIRLAITYSNLALVYQNTGKYSQARAYYHETLIIHEKIFGENDPKVATVLNNLASLYFIQGNYSKAELFFKKSLAINEQALGTEQPTVALNCDNLASIYYTQGRLVEAEAFYQRALAIREKALGPNNPEVAVTLNNLAMLYRSRGDLVRSEPLMNRAAAILGETEARDQPGKAQRAKQKNEASKPLLLANSNPKGEFAPGEEKVGTAKASAGTAKKPRFFVNPGGKAYHYPWCTYVKHALDNALQFAEVTVANRAGYRACRRCDPQE
jgi:tetratricopeptide (TPR) repeat protein